MSTQYFIVFAQAHSEFRIPELLSVAELHGFTVLLPLPHELDISRPFMIIALEKEEHVSILARRCVLIK